MLFSPIMLPGLTLLTAPSLFSSLLDSASLNVVLRRLLSGICGLTYKEESGAFLKISFSKERMLERKKHRERERSDLYIALEKILCYWSQIMASTTFLRALLSRSAGSQSWQVLLLPLSIPSDKRGCMWRN